VSEEDDEDGVGGVAGAEEEDSVATVEVAVLDGLEEALSGGAGAFSSEGISSVDRSSPSSARIAMRAPTFTALLPSPS
jgi:hypothetical protein